LTRTTLQARNGGESAVTQDSNRPPTKFKERGEVIRMKRGGKGVKETNLVLRAIR